MEKKNVGLFSEIKFCVVYNTNICYRFGNMSENQGIDIKHKIIILVYFYVYK